MPHPAPLPALTTRAHILATELAQRAVLVPMPLGHADLQRQIIRAASSVPLNVAEGVARGADGRYQLRIAMGSLAEVQSALHIAGHHELDELIVRVQAAIREQTRAPLQNPRRGKGRQAPRRHK